MRDCTTQTEEKKRAVLAHLTIDLPAPTYNRCHRLTESDERLRGILSLYARIPFNIHLKKRLCILPLHPSVQSEGPVLVLWHNCTNVLPLRRVVPPCPIIHAAL